MNPSPLTKILYFTDSQLTAKTPEGRTDVLQVAIFRKLTELGMIANAYNVDAIVCGGDFFDLPRVSLKFAGMITDIIQSWGKPLYVVPGNHDIYGYTIANIDQTMLGYMAQAGVLTLLTKGQPIYFDYPNLQVIVEGQEYHKDIDTGLQPDYRMTMTNSLKQTVGILIPHSMLVDRPYIAGAYTLIKDVAYTTDANVILGSHYHPGWDTVVENNVLFYNPGSLIRIANTPDAKTRQVKVGIVTVFDTGQVGVVDVPLKTMLPYDQVFSSINKVKTLQAADDLALMSSFKSSLSTGLSGLSHATSIRDMITELLATSSGNDLSVIQAAESIINEVVNNNLNNDLSVAGFVADAARKVISSIELTNFMSYEHAVMDFTDGFNVIVGESSVGKTTGFRAIAWALYDTPKGTGMIRTGETKTTVKINYTDGSSIERWRSLSSAGEVSTVAADGTSNVFKGFANKLPIDMANIHQMPFVNITDTVKANLNYSKQLAGPFLLSESSFDKAVAIGKLTGADLADYAIKANAKNLATLDAAIKRTTAEIDSKTIELEKYAYLDDYKLQINKFEQLLTLVEDKSIELSSLKSLDTEYTMSQTVVNEASVALSTLSSLDLHASIVEGFTNTLASLKVKQELDEQYTEALRVKSVSSAEVFKLRDIDAVDTIISNHTMVLNNIKMLSYWRDTINAAAIESRRLAKTQIKEEYVAYCEKTAEGYYKALAKIKTLTNLLEQYDGLVLLTEAKQHTIADLDKEIEENEQVYFKLLEERNQFIINSLGTCPLCGANIESKHQIDNILNGGITHDC